MRITGKRQMKHLQARGSLGNCMRSWSSLDAAVAEGYRGPFYLRSDERMDTRKAFEVDLPTARRLVRSGDRIYEAPPNEWRVFQGEVQYTVEGLYVFGTWRAEPLRDALLTDGCHFIGLEALHVLQRNLWPSSVDEIRDWLNLYDGHVVEFSEFDRPIGTYQRRLLIWEIRDY